MEQAQRIAIVQSIKQASQDSGGMADASFGGDGITTNDFFNIPVMQGGTMKIIEDGGSVESSLQSEDLMRSMFVKFNALSDGPTAFLDAMLVVTGPFPKARQRMQNFIKFFGNVKLSGLSVFKMTNMPKSLSLKDRSQEQE